MSPRSIVGRNPATFQQDLNTFLQNVQPGQHRDRLSGLLVPLFLLLYNILQPHQHFIQQNGIDDWKFCLKTVNWDRFPRFTAVVRYLNHFESTNRTATGNYQRPLTLFKVCPLPFGNTPSMYLYFICLTCEFSVCDIFLLEFEEIDPVEHCNISRKKRPANI